MGVFHAHCQTLASFADPGWETAVAATPTAPADSLPNFLNYWPWNAGFLIQE